jgi:hypothetical protein
VSLSQEITQVLDYSTAQMGLTKATVRSVKESYPLQSQDFGPLRFEHVVTGSPLLGNTNNLKVFTFSIFGSDYSQDLFCSVNHRIPRSCSFHFETGDPTKGYYLFVLDDDFEARVGDKLEFEIYPIRQEISFLRKNFFVYPDSGDHPIQLDVVDKSDTLQSSHNFTLNVKPARLSSFDFRVLTYEPGERNILKMRLRNWLPINTVSKGRYLLSFIIKGTLHF